MMKTIRQIPTVAAALGFAIMMGPLPLQAEPGSLLLYAASLSGNVTAYDAGASGAVAAVAVIAGPVTQVQDSWAVAFDPAGDLLVQNFLGRSTTVVFAPNVSGDVAPVRVFSNNTGARDACSIAVDSKGNVYIPRITSVPILEVFAPNARGATPPARTLQLDGVPTGVTIDADDNVIVGLLNTPTGNAIEVFSPTAQGAAQPLRRISGPATGLGSGNFYNGGFLAVNYSPFTQRLYAAVCGDFNPAVLAHISVFAEDANGDISPVRTIGGPATLLGESITGLASNQETGEIFALSVNAKFAAPAMVHVYAPLAQGNVAPLRSFTDGLTKLQYARGIAFGPPPPRVVAK